MVNVELSILTHDLSRGLNQDIEYNRFNGFLIKVNIFQVQKFAHS